MCDVILCWRQAMMRTPTRPAAGSHVLFEHFWVEAGPLPVPEEDGEGSERGFIMTPSVAAHLRNLARAALIRRYPVLLQARHHSVRGQDVLKWLFGFVNEGCLHTYASWRGAAVMPHNKCASPGVAHTF